MRLCGVVTTWSPSGRTLAPGEARIAGVGQRPEDAHRLKLIGQRHAVEAAQHHEVGAIERPADEPSGTEKTRTSGIGYCAILVDQGERRDRIAVRGERKRQRW